MRHDVMRGAIVGAILGPFLLVCFILASFQWGDHGAAIYCLGLATVSLGTVHWYDRSE